MNASTLDRQRAERAATIARAGGIEAALSGGGLPRRLDVTTSEALVLGLLRQDVRVFLTVLGHGSTEVGEVLRIYEGAGLLRTVAVRHETEAAHAATALRWVRGQRAAVVTSIGPGALHAFAGSLASASDGIGVWHLYGDETTEEEGPNMQGLPPGRGGGFLQLMGAMGAAHLLHTPRSIGPMLRRGLNVVDHPHRQGPFFTLLPLNVQPQVIEDFNVDELPVGAPPRLGAAADGPAYREAAQRLLQAERVVVKVGNGARCAGPQLARLLELVDGVCVVAPIASGVLPYEHQRVMGVGGSKGSISGNHAMAEADLLLAVGTRAVCQSDSSRTGYPKVRHVVNVNTDIDAATHYQRTTALVGEAGATLERLIAELEALGTEPSSESSPWLEACGEHKARWQAFKQERRDHPTLFDEVWQRRVLTQPAAIDVVARWARTVGPMFFDAGDVQANGFQTVEDDRLGRTYTETGASYMGFAVSALLATAIADEPFYGVAVTGDGSFTMNPQILIDGVQHGARGCIVLLDNRRMAAISSLQRAQYGHDHATSDAVEVDYLAWARAVTGVQALDGGDTPTALRVALERAAAYEGLTLVHVPVYFGDDPLGGLGAYGRWNVGNWVAQTQALRHDLAL